MQATTYEIYAFTEFCLFGKFVPRRILYFLCPRIPLTSPVNPFATFIHITGGQLTVTIGLIMGISFLGADLAPGQNWVMCPESRLRSAYSILGISAGNLGDTLISKWGFRSGGGGRRIKYRASCQKFGPKVGILAGVGRGKLTKFVNTAKSYRNCKIGLRVKICSHYGDFLGKGPKLADFKQNYRKNKKFHKNNRILIFFDSKAATRYP